MAILGFDIGILLNNIFRTIFYMLDIIIYKLMINIYNVFIMLCNGRLLNNDTIKQLSSRVGTILGVIMMFMVIFSFIQLLINPEAMNDKEKGIGNIAKKILIVIIMLGTYSYVFNLLANIQVAVISSNSIANLLVPSSVNTKNFGEALSGNLLTAFYTSNFTEDEFEHECTTEQFEENFKNEIATNHDFSYGYKCLYETDDTLFGTTTYLRDFNWLLSSIVGVVVVYFIFYYCISVGMRIIQLAFLQIIAPMPIISYLSPKKDNMFNKWAKIYFTTYIDVFIRIAIINFVAYLIGVIMDNWNSGNGVFWESIGINTTTEIGLKTIVGVIMILALLLFAKKAPDLLKELFPTAPGSLGFGIKSPSALMKDTPGLARAYGAGRVALGVARGNAFRAIGKVLDTNQDIKNADDLFDDAQRRYQTARQNGDKAAATEAFNDMYNAKQIIKSKNAERKQWLKRGVTGALGGLVSGSVAGVRTTDASGRKTAISNSLNRTKSNWKMTDAGYDFRARANDTVRGAFFRDTEIEQRADAADYNVEALQRELHTLQEKYANDPKVDLKNIQKDKINGGYILVDDAGNIKTGVTPTKEEKQLADLNSKIGKAKSTSSALHQKENETKNKQ